MLGTVDFVLLVKCLFCLWLTTKAEPSITVCPKSMRACSSGMCLPEKWFCDGEKDCPYGEDETSCGFHGPWQPQPQTPAPWFNPWQSQPNPDSIPFPPPPAPWQLQFPPQTAPPLIFPPSDPWTNIPCPSDTFACGSSCLPASLRCNGIIDCSDGSDEVNCPVIPEPTSSGCAVDEVRCFTGKCIKILQICDGFTDCEHYEDEFACAFTKNKEFTYRCIERCFGIPKSNCSVTTAAPPTPPRTAPTTRPPIRFCDLGYTLIFDRCIKVTVFPPLPWEGARQASLAAGSILVEIDNGNFFLELQGYLNQSQYESYSYWTSANDLLTEGDWIWSSPLKKVHLGAPLWSIAREGLTYQQQPAGGREQNCGLLEDCPFQYMNDEVCDRKYPYISQRPARVKSW